MGRARLVELLGEQRASFVESLGRNILLLNESPAEDVGLLRPEAAAFGRVLRSVLQLLLDQLELLALIPRVRLRQVLGNLGQGRNRLVGDSRLSAKLGLAGGRKLFGDLEDHLLVNLGSLKRLTVAVVEVLHEDGVGEFLLRLGLVDKGRPEQRERGHSVD